MKSLFRDLMVLRFQSDKMSNTSNTDAILTQAAKKEKEYDWLGAAETYAKGLDAIPVPDFSGSGDLHERLGYAFRKAAMQAEDVNEFKNRMNKAADHYRKAFEAFERVNDSEAADAKGLRCDAAKAYVEHWLASDSSEKKKWLDECWKLVAESMRTFEKAEERSEFVKTYVQLSDAAIFLFTREPDFKSREKVIQEAVDSGEKAIEFLATSEDVHELAMACARTVVFLGVFSYYFRDINEREKYRQEGLNYWGKAKQLSEEVAMSEYVYPVFGGQVFFGLEGSNKAFENCTKALEYGRKMNDKFIVGCALDWLVYHTAWKLEGTDDPAEKDRAIEKCLKYAEESLREFSKVPFVSPRGDLAWTKSIEIMRIVWRARAETDLKKKRVFTEEAFQWGLRNRKLYEESGYPEIMMNWYAGAASFRHRLAKFETEPVDRKRGLEEAFAYINKRKEIAERLEPFLYWNIGIGRSSLGNIEYELAEVTEDSEKKKGLLGAAVADKQKAIELCIKELTYMTRKGSGTSLFATVGALQYGYAQALVHLYELTGDREHLKKAGQSYDASTESYQKLSLVSRIAENCWRRAQVFDKLGEHLTASQDFDCAARSYASALEKFPQLKAFYNDHALYMQAWSEIEKARFHHQKQEYSMAKEHFDKASGLHKSLKRWNYLGPNYSAWAKLDEAEELSRKERSEEALQAFEAASTLFEETRKSLENQLLTIEDDEEKEMAKEMLNATDLRHQYCAARVAVEEAKIFDKKGDHFSSSEKYSSAAEILEGIQEAVETERDKKEFKLIATLSQAWAKMTLAEAEESPGLYAEASQLFEKAKELSPNEKAKTLALGHSRFCRALEAGMEFSDTGNEKLHNVAVQQLGSAAKYYVKAGVQSASEYAKATELLLDAYSNINNAKKEADPERKTKLFAMAQKILQTSAGSFMKAEHPEKREQVLRLLDKVKEERELAMSLSEILHTPAIVSTTMAFSTPTPNHENAVGIEKFENANIQANIISRQKQLKIGENLDLEIELVNAGKGPALLIKITDLIPKGFELAENPEVYRVEDSYLNMKGKRVDPLKTEEVRLRLKPKVQGEFSFKPTVLYLDENGQYKSNQPEPLTLTVTELGIKGWLKGEK
jgi:tetratricopeptide (TPR) repeat protein